MCYSSTCAIETRGTCGGRPDQTKPDQAWPARPGLGQVFGQNGQKWSILTILTILAKIGRLWYRVATACGNSIPQAGIWGGFGSSFGAPKARFARLPGFPYGCSFGGP